jgi:hypothetical protein
MFLFFFWLKFTLGFLSLFFLQSYRCFLRASSYRCCGCACAVRVKPLAQCYCGWPWPGFHNGLDPHDIVDRIKSFWPPQVLGEFGFLPDVQNRVFKAPHLPNPCGFPPSAVLLAWDPLVVLSVSLSLLFLPHPVLPLSPRSPPSLPPRHLVPAAARRASQQGPRGVAATAWWGSVAARRRWCCSCSTTARREVEAE